MKSKQILSYSIIKDAHMFYYLQSAPKVKELISSSLYKLEGNMLIQIETKNSIKLDAYILQELKGTPFKKVQQNSLFHSTVNSKKFKAFEEEKGRVQKMRLNKSLEGSRIAKIEKAYRSIKGLKEFMLKRVR